MIVEFKISNFGSIKEQQVLSFEATTDETLEEYYVHEPIPGLRLLKLGLIYGPNASGKTTVLKALNFLRDLFFETPKSKSTRLNYEPFFGDGFDKKPSELELTFVQNAIKYIYNVSFNKKYILTEKLVYYPKGRPAEFFTRNSDYEKKLSIISFGNTLKVPSKTANIIEGNTLWNATVFSAINKSNVEFPAAEEVLGWFSDTLRGLITPGTDLMDWVNGQVEDSTEFRNSVVDIVRKADLQLFDIQVESEEKELDDETIEMILSSPVLSQDHKDKIQEDRKIIVQDTFFVHRIKNHEGAYIEKRLQKKQQSTGTIRYYGLGGVLAFLINEQHIVPIDEVETSLHPDLMKNLILTFLMNSENSQLIVTTHNIFFLDEKDILRNDSVWFTEKQHDGSTELFSLADFNSSILRKNSSVINSYKIGKLGAKPNLGNVYIER